MDQALEVFIQYQDKIISVLTWAGSIGAIDLILRKLPTEKPRTILLSIQAVLRIAIRILEGLDKIIESIPFMKQNIKAVEKK